MNYYDHSFFKNAFFSAQTFKDRAEGKQHIKKKPTKTKTKTKTKTQKDTNKTPRLGGL